MSVVDAFSIFQSQVLLWCNIASVVLAHVTWLLVHHCCTNNLIMILTNGNVRYKQDDSKSVISLGMGRSVSPVCYCSVWKRAEHCALIICLTVLWKSVRPFPDYLFLIFWNICHTYIIQIIKHIFILYIDNGDKIKVGCTRFILCG